MSRTVASTLAGALALSLAGCVTIHGLGAGPEPLTETVVYGVAGPKVALIEIDDVITEHERRGALGLGRRESTTAMVQEQLDHARQADVAGLLVRINSPGGGVTASDVVYNEIKRFKDEYEVPVVAQMMGVAASGGYYVAMAADYVIAHPTTVTGSIGVIAGGLNFSGLMSQYGVEDQTITAGDMKDAGSPLRPMTPAERAYLQAVVDDMHGRFREVVQAGRPGLEKDQVWALSDGRIFTAKDAQEKGLVDAVGYMSDTVEELQRRIQAPDIRVVSYHREREWRANLYSASAAPAPQPRATLAERLGLDRGPAFLYLWMPGASF